MTARRMPNGLLRPEFADLLEGARVAEDLGLDPATIPHQALVAMGRAVSDQAMATYRGPIYPNEGRDLVPSPELAQALDQIMAKRDANPYPRWGIPADAQAQDQAQPQPAPDALAKSHAQHPGDGSSAARGLGQASRAERGHQQDHDRNGKTEKIDLIKDYLRRVPDPPDEEWS